MNEKRGFLEQTAQDYNISYTVVENYYYRYYHTGEFYDKLEEYIKDRANGN